MAPPVVSGMETFRYGARLKGLKRAPISVYPAVDFRLRFKATGTTSRPMAYGRVSGIIAICPETMVNYRIEASASNPVDFHYRIKADVYVGAIAPDESGITWSYNLEQLYNVLREYNSDTSVQNEVLPISSYNLEQLYNTFLEYNDSTSPNITRHEVFTNWIPINGLTDAITAENPQKVSEQTAAQIMAPIIEAMPEIQEQSYVVVYSVEANGSAFVRTNADGSGLVFAYPSRTTTFGGAWERQTILYRYQGAVAIAMTSEFVPMDSNGVAYQNTDISYQLTNHNPEDPVSLFWQSTGVDGLSSGADQIIAQTTAGGEAEFGGTAFQSSSLMYSIGDLINLIPPEPGLRYAVRKSGGDPNSYLYWESQPTVRSYDDWVVTSSLENIGVSCDLAIIEEVQTEYGPWFTGRINGNGQLDQDGAGAKPVSVPLDLPVLSALSNVVYGFEITSKHPVMGYFAGSASSATINSKDILKLRSNYMETIEYQTVWEGSRITGKHPVSIISGQDKSFEVSFINPHYDPSWDMGITNLQLVIDTDNHNTRLQLLDNLPPFDTDAIVLKVRAQATVRSKHLTPWYPQVREGYYYLNSEERYLYASQGVRSDPIEIDDYTVKSVEHVIEVDGYTFVPKKSVAVTTSFLDPTPGVSSNTKFDNGLVAQNPEAEGLFESELISLPIRVDEWMATNWFAEISGTGQVNLEIAVGDDGVVGDWVGVSNGEIPSLPPGNIFQYRIRIIPGTTFKEELSYLADSLTEDFAASDLINASTSIPPSWQIGRMNIPGFISPLDPQVEINGTHAIAPNGVVVLHPNSDATLVVEEPTNTVYIQFSDSESDADYADIFIDNAYYTRYQTQNTGDLYVKITSLPLAPHRVTVRASGSGNVYLQAIATANEDTPQGYVTILDLDQGQAFAFSPVKDLTENVARLGRLTTGQFAPEGSSVKVYTVSSNSPTGPWDGSGEPWMLPDSNGNIQSAAKRYLRWVAVFETNGIARPILDSVRLGIFTYVTVPDPVRLIFITMGGFREGYVEPRTFEIPGSVQIVANGTDQPLLGIPTCAFVNEYVDTQDWDSPIIEGVLYNVYRSLTRTGGSQLIGTTDGTTFVDTYAGNESAFYRVAVLDQSGQERAYSGILEPQQCVVPAGVVEEDNSLVHFNGAWEAITHASASESWYVRTVNRYDPAAIDSFSLTFYGTGISIHSTKDAVFGMADVYLDDVFVETIDYYRSMTGYGQLMFLVAGLEPGLHTIRIATDGQKNESSTGWRISADTFTIVGPTLPSTLDQPMELIGVVSEGNRTLIWGPMPQATYSIETNYPEAVLAYQPTGDDIPQITFPAEPIKSLVHDRFVLDANRQFRVYPVPRGLAPVIVITADQRSLRYIPPEDSVIEGSFQIEYSTDLNRDSALISIHDSLLNPGDRVDVYFATNESNHVIYEHLDLKPINHLGHDAFLYVSDYVPSPARVKLSLFAVGGQALSGQVLVQDAQSNPVEGIIVNLSTDSGLVIPDITTGTGGIGSFLVLLEGISDLVVTATVGNLSDSVTIHLTNETVGWDIALTAERNAVKLGEVVELEVTLRDQNQRPLVNTPVTIIAPGAVVENDGQKRIGLNGKVSFKLEPNEGSLISVTASAKDEEGYQYASRLNLKVV